MGKPRTGRNIPPPLELLCLNALWSLGEATVREVQSALRARPLAYTTVMTLLDRLVRKGTVGRRKGGRAYIYCPRVSRDALRGLALRQFADLYFDGSVADMAAWLRRETAPRPSADAAAV